MSKHSASKPLSDCFESHFSKHSLHLPHDNTHTNLPHAFNDKMFNRANCITYNQIGILWPSTIIADLKRYNFGFEPQPKVYKFHNKMLIRMELFCEIEQCKHSNKISCEQSLNIILAWN